MLAFEVLSQLKYHYSVVSKIFVYMLMIGVLLDINLINYHIHFFLKVAGLTLFVTGKGCSAQMWGPVHS